MDSLPLVSRSLRLHSALNTSCGVRAGRLHTSQPRDMRPVSLGGTLRENPRDITGLLDNSLCVPFAGPVQELSRADSALRRKVRGRRGTSGEWKVEIRKDEEDTDELHKDILAFLVPCKSLVPELDLTSQLITHQKRLLSKDKFLTWKAGQSQSAENESLLERRTQPRPRFSYQFSVSRPDSATKEDFYAAKLIGNTDKAVTFGQLLKDVIRGETDCLYEALDLLLEAKGESHTMMNQMLTAVVDDLRVKTKTFLTAPLQKTEADLVEMMTFLTQGHRIILKEISQSEICESLSTLWKLSVLTFDCALQLSASELEKAKKRHQEQMLEAETQANRQLTVTIIDLQGKIAKLTEECKRLSSVIDRLRIEKTTLTDILSDRDDEISQLKLPPNLKDFDRLLEDMTSYLAEAEDRQISQAQMLESISVMLDTTRVQSEKKRRRRRSPDGGKSPISPGKGDFTPSRFSEKVFFPAPSISSAAVNTETKTTPILPETVEVTEDSSDSENSEMKFAEQEIQTEMTWDAEDGLQKRKPPKEIIEHPLLRELQKVKKRQPAMSESAVLRFMEQVVEEKFKLDVFREESKQSYDPLPDFLLSYLYTISGLKSVVGKTLSGLLGGLEKLTAPGHPYGLLMCRFLNIYEAGSIPADLEIFLTKTQAAFCRLHPNYMKVFPELGGSAPLVEVSDLVSVLFASRWDSAARVLAECRPPDLSETDMVSMLVCGKLGKLGRDLKYFFVQIDTEKCGTVTFKAFSEGIKHVLSIPLTPAKLDLLWNSFQTDRLTFQHISMLSFKELNQKADSKLALVTRFQLLSAIIHEYEYLHSLETTKLMALFHQHDANDDGILTLDEFKDLIQALDPQASLPSIVLLFRRALDSSDNGEDGNVDAIVPETFCRLAIEHRLGGAGKLGFDVSLRACNPILRQILEKGNEKASGRSPLKRKTKK